MPELVNQNIPPTPFIILLDMRVYLNQHMIPNLCSFYNHTLEGVPRLIAR